MTFVLNLDNFECHFLATSTPDVLNSPRSLAACATLGIQPVELVYRSLEEYEESLGDFPLSQIYQLFEIDETERQSKLLKCRELRKRMISDSEDTWRTDAKVKKKQRASTCTAMATANDTGRRRLPEFGGSDTEINYGSDTESHEDFWSSKETEGKGDLNRRRSQPIKKRLIEIPSKFKTRSNTDFKKIVSSPRHICSCHVTLNDDEIANDYMHRYGDILSRTNLSRDDKKILELLLLRKAKDTEWTKKAQELRQVIEQDKIAQVKRNELKTQTWAERLAEKRRLANIESTNRYLVLEQEANERRMNLLQCLESRDIKLHNYLDQLQYKKQTQMIERHKLDALRQLEVGKTMERILEQDRLQRLELSQKLERRMYNSELRRKRRERENLRHIAEMNRLEEIKRDLKHDQLEQEARQSTEVLRSQIEEKEHRATVKYLENLRLRNILKGASSRKQTVERTRLAHLELVQGLQEWNKKVYDLHLAAQERATLNHFAEISRRRARVVTERILREDRAVQIQKRVKEMQEQRMSLMKAVIEAKDFRSAKLKEEKEQRMYDLRLRAQHGAELREALKEKMDPETFDKKVARAEIEYQLFHKHLPQPVRLTNHIPRVNVDGQICCRCGCGSLIGAPQLRPSRI